MNKRELVFEDVQNRILGLLGEKVETKIYKEEEGEEAMGMPEEKGEAAENETPEEETKEESEGDMDIENMSYDDKMSLVLEIIDSFEDEEEQVKFVEELQSELEGMVETEEEGEEEEDMEEESDAEEEEDDFE